jgi:hypothetical protein
MHNVTLGESGTRYIQPFARMLLCVVALMFCFIAATAPDTAHAQTQPERAVLSKDDMSKVSKWIGQRVSDSKQAFCYRQSEARGAGVPLSTCQPGQEKDGLLCYPNCRQGFNGVGPVCWQNCPSGFRNDGAYCGKPGAYGRGAGYPWKGKDGLSDKGMFERCEAENGRGNCEKDGAIVYPKCRAGFHKVGCCTCSPNCPSGMKDIGVSCEKPTYGRGAGEPMKCKLGEIEDAGLCYRPCTNPAFKGVGPVCWQQCQGGRKECGVGCTTDTLTCVSDTLNMVTAPLIMAVNIITLGSGSSATKSASMAAKTTKAMDALKKAEKIVDITSKVGEAALVANDIYETSKSWSDDYIADFENVTTREVLNRINSEFPNPEANRWVKRQYALVHLSMVAKANGIQTAQTALSAVALVDPIGVAGVVEAFLKPICSSNDPFPSVRKLY